MKVKKLALEEGMYKQAEEESMGFGQWLENHYAEKAGEKSIYTGKSMIEQEMIKIALRKQGKAESEIPLTALDIQLQAHGIKATGQFATDPVSKFFGTGESATLFPAFVSSRLVVGMLLDSLVPEFTAFTEVVSEDNYKKVTLEDTEDNRQLRQIGEGGEMPGVRIKVGKEMVMLKKYGRYLEASYESIRGMSLNVFGTFIQRMGAQVKIDETDDMIYVHVNGDGNSNTPTTTVETASSGTIAVADVINWATGLPAPYKMDKFIGKKALLQEYWATLAGMSNPYDQFGFVGIGLPKAFEWDRASVTADNFYGVDSRYALAHLSMGEPKVETEKLIRHQIEGTAMSVYSGFMVLDNDAEAIFDETHT